MSIWCGGMWTWTRQKISSNCFISTIQRLANETPRVRSQVGSMTRTNERRAPLTRQHAVLETRLSYHETDELWRTKVSITRRQRPRMKMFYMSRDDKRDDTYKPNEQSDQQPKDELPTSCWEPIGRKSNRVEKPIDDSSMSRYANN